MAKASKATGSDTHVAVVSAGTGSGARPHTGSLVVAAPTAAALSLAPPQTSDAKATLMAGNDAVWRSSAAKRAERAWAVQSERSLANDPKFKKYQSTIERTLATFDSVSEWADFISFLTRLQKALHAQSSFNVIPRRLIVAKRLSQCLNPALPSGVHQKALEVYEQILTSIGRDGLRRDLHIWSPGIFPFFQFASTSVRPNLLSIFDRFYLPLGEDLRPVAKAMLLALLPGLEEESGEFFDRVLRLLDHVSTSITESFFLQNIWLIIITALPVRLAALNYLLRRLPKLDKLTGADATKVVGQDLGLMVRAFTAALRDDALLVRRLTLDLLVTHLPVRCHTFSHVIKPDDAIMLIGAATAVVLRRDLSLNRRLYSWLLGPEDEDQNKYLMKYSLDFVRLSLIQGLNRSSNMDVDATMEAQEPYRVFISLLDKWEIGQPLSNVIILDIFSSLQKLREAGTTAMPEQDGMGTTAKMLFEVVDPFAMYRQFYFALKHELDPAVNATNQTTASTRTVEEEKDSAVKLLAFVLKSFPVHDDETRQIHLPALFSGLLHLILQLFRRETIPASTDVAEALFLAQQILALIPPKVFVRVSQEAQVAESSNLAAEGDFGQQVELFYAPRDPLAGEAKRLVLSFQRAEVVLALLQLAAKLSDETMLQDRLKALRPLAISVLRNILQAVQASETAHVALPMGVDGMQPRVQWDVDTWSVKALRALGTATEPEDIDALASCLIACATCDALQKPLSLHGRAAVELIIDKLFALLTRDMISLHQQASELITAVHVLAPERLVEASICRRLSQPSLQPRLAAFEALGILWKVLDDRDESAQFLDLPLRLVLDGLRSSHVAERQAAEAWLRNYVKSFARIVTPCLRQMLEVPLTLRPCSQQISGIQVTGFAYEQPFDCKILSYSVISLSSIVKEGGLACLRTLRSTLVRSCRDPALVQLSVQAGFSVEQTLLELILDLAARFLRTSCPEAYRASIGLAVTTLQAEAADLIQFIASRQHLESPKSEELKQVVIQCTAKAIADGDLLGQNKLLHALHALLHGRSNIEESGGDTVRSAKAAALPGKVGNELLKLLRAGLAVQCNRPALHHWADFAFSILPIVRHEIADFLVPLADCVCQLLREELAELEVVCLHGTRTDITDAELTTLINLAERIINLCIEETAGVSNNGDTTEPLTPNPVAQKDVSAGLLGFVTGSRTVTSGKDADEGAIASFSADAILQRFVGDLLVAWRMCSRKFPGDARRDLGVITAIFIKTKARCRRALERLYRMRSADVVMALISSVQEPGPGKLRDLDTLFEVLDALVPSEQIAVTYICDALVNRLESPSDKGKRKPSYPHVLDDSLFALLEAYNSRLDGTRAAQVWPVLHVMAKDVTVQSSALGAAIYGVLRILGAVGAKLSEAKVFEDKRFRKDVQDIFLKVLDSSILIAGRAPEASLFGRRAARDADEDDQTSKGDGAEEEKMAASLADLSEHALADQMIMQMADRSFPTLRQMTLDADRLQAVYTNAMYYVVGPALKTKSRNFDVDVATLELLRQLCSMPHSVKTWRSQVYEAFHDARFFRVSSVAVDRWKPIILHLYTLDKERLSEAISRIGAAQSANIFTNREAEARLRASNIRRLSFILFTANVDFWLPHFPAIQERIVDILKASVSEVVEAEIWLCLRVVLCRFSPQHLSSMWPVIISEMMEAFEALIDGLATLGSDRVRVLGELSKFLDLLLTMQTPDFQVHQWLFVPDTTDVVYPPDDWVSEALVDRVTQALMEQRPAIKSNKVKDGQTTASSTEVATGTLPLRRPMLRSGPIESVDELATFFRYVSISAYEAVYATQGIDQRYIEHCLLEDMFNERET
ncbi:hypothetical protein K437DRAFT_257137 [Tilletiaria anomala UBC 951]|uniref:Uncharacterized protein n=1 Tax=Tilletiaria anomala (strain ATCC 24038 / CBS 436.72 / UBC 951) TaxID=1037660 RepID=A0A066VVG2_TILAU|nr:uncharacterized protein K437DRAFT_257137 [Tilletiaria anomala UBC 951]KDN44268.1 hypothetical protein K437DRAFT_257137 [Tilletiaria anomala UBC 951]